MAFVSAILMIFFYHRLVYLVSIHFLQRVSALRRLLRNVLDSGLSDNFTQLSRRRYDNFFAQSFIFNSSLLFICRRDGFIAVELTIRIGLLNGKVNFYGLNLFLQKFRFLGNDWPMNSLKY